MGLFDPGGFYQSFTPPTYTEERSYLNPMIWGTLNQQMSGQPTMADWANRTAGINAARQNWMDSRRMAGMNYGARGLGDSGWLQQEYGNLLGQRASQEAQVISDFWNNILSRQMQAAGTTGNYLAGARAGSGTYTYKG